jgi:hypothetical protein
MKRFVLLLAASATMLVPAAPAFAASSSRPNAVEGAMSAPAATAQLDSVSKIPPELCFAFFGSDLENLVCSSR